MTRRRCAFSGEDPQDVWPRWLAHPERPAVGVAYASLTQVTSDHMGGRFTF